MKKSMLSVFLALVFVVVVVSGCAPTSTPVPPTDTPSPIPPTLTPEPTATPITYQVTMDVVDEKGNPIPNAEIIRGETVEMADNQGVWLNTLQTSNLSAGVWAQGYLFQNQSSTLQPGNNKITVQLSVDPKSLQLADLTQKGYKLVFADDFQDRISRCKIDGNGNVIQDDTDPANYLLLVDLRNLNDASFSCSFGPTNIQNAIIEVDFRYVDIRFSDFNQNNPNSYYNWQGYLIGFRDGIDVDGYPLQVPWGPTLQITDYRESTWKYPITVKQGIVENRWYQLYTKYDGPTVEVRMNGSLRFTYLNAPTTSNTTPAHIGAFNQAHIEFDNIKMWVPNN